MNDYEGAVELENQRLRADVARLMDEVQKANAYRAQTEGLPTAIVQAEDKARVATRERDEARARRWVQCTTTSNDCLGGCASMREHDAYMQSTLLQELENLRPLVVLHEDMTQQCRKAEMERDEARKDSETWEYRATEAQRKVLEAQRERDAAQGQCAAAERAHNEAAVMLRDMRERIEPYVAHVRRGDFTPDATADLLLVEVAEAYDASIDTDAPPPVDWKARAERAEAVVEAARSWLVESEADEQGRPGMERIGRALAAYDVVKT